MSTKLNIDSLDTDSLNFNIILYNAYFRGCAELVKSIIFPSTANEVEKQYVCVTLEVQLPGGYPDCKPVIRLKSPRGLDDSTIDHLHKEIEKKCEEYIGQPVIYELIEVSSKIYTRS